MATAQEFDALDGLTITGGLEVGANVAVDTNVLFVDSVNNRVGINTIPSTGKVLQIVVPTGESAAVSSSGGLVTEASYWSAQDRARFGYSNGKVLIDDKNTSGSTTTKSLEINLNSITRALFDPSANTIALTGDVNITAPTGGGLDVDGTDTAESVFHAASDSTGFGAVAARWMYTSFIEAHAEKGTTSCGIAIGAITGGVAENGTDEISIITNGFQVANFQTSAILLNKPTTVSGALTVTTGNKVITPTIEAPSDTNTFINFPAADTIRLTTGGNPRAEFDATEATINTMVKAYGYKENVTAATSGGTTRDIAVGTATASVFTYTLNSTASSTTNIRFFNVPTTGSYTWTIQITAGNTNQSINWLAYSGGAGTGLLNLRFAEGVQPPESTGTGDIDIYTFTVINGVVYGTLSIRNAG